MTVRATPEAQARLLDLQAMDTRTQQLAHAKRVLPQLAAITALATESEGLRRQVGGHRGTLDDLRAQLKRIESDVALVETRIARDTQRLQTSTSTKDVAGLEHELASLARRRSDLEDVELDLMERIETEEKALAGIEEEQASLASRTEQLTGERDEAVAKLDTEAGQLVAARESLVRELPADLVELYERQRSRYGIGAALLRRGVSGGSNVALGASDLAAVRSAAPDEIVLDPESGCILVRTEESGL